MASFDYRLNPLYTIKECSSCGALYTTDYCCSKGSLVDKIIRERPPQNCATCGDPVDGLYCRPCAFVRKCLNEGWFTIHDKNEILNTSESSNDDTNVVSAPQEPFVFNQDPGKNSSQSPPHIDHHCCYTSCRDSIDDNLLPTMYYGPPDSLIMKDEHLDTIPTTESDEVIESSVENLVPIPSESGLVSLEEVKDFHTEDGEIEDDILREKLSKVNLLIAKIEAINSNPPLSSDFMTKIIVAVPLLVLIILFQIMKIFYLDDDHIEEKSSGSTTTHAEFSQYDSFIFDLSINPFPPADRSDFYHEEFADELAHIISPPEYDCFYFKSEPDPGELTSIVDSGIRENVLSTTNVNLPFEDDQSPLLAYVVWIFLPFLTYPVTPPYLLSCGNEDTIFDPGISVYHSFMPSVSHRSGTFMKFNVYPNHLNESPMEILSSTCSPMDQ
ncbi:hypothetical protein Tco_1467109 [Tanacetum coccineum]